MRSSTHRVLASAILLAGVLRLGAAEVVILDYHSFLGDSRSALNYSPAAFAAHLDAIRELGYRFVSLEDAMAGRIEGKANVVVTIDDGHRSVYQAYREVLAPRSIRPALFIYPAPIGRDERFLSVAELAELATAGCAVGAHGYHHEYMTPKAWERDRATVAAEVTKPAAALGRILGGRPRLFAIPFGVGSPQATALLRKEGYEWVFLADEKVQAVDFSDPRLDRYAVPRTIVYRWNLDSIMRALAARLE